jgi:CIC family chloride channel protein
MPLLSYLATRPPGEKRFLLSVPLVGVITGVAAVLLMRLLELIQGIFWGSRHDLLAPALELSATHRLLAPTLGGIAVGCMVLLARGPLRGHGASGIIEAVATRGGFIPMKATMLRVGATLLTVGSGGSLGREGPLVRVGAALSSFLGRRLGLPGHRIKILVGCGAAAGIAAAYNAPVGGALFAMEVILGNFALESFGPIVISSVIATVITRTFSGRDPAYSPPEHVILGSPWELGHYLFMGLLIGIASALFIVALRSAERGFTRLRIPEWLKPVLGFGLVGVIGIWFPHVFGNGYDTTNLVLNESLPFSLQLMLILALLKVMATALTLGSGGAGGLFTPTLFVGAVLGSAYGGWCQLLLPGTTSGPGAYALVGMAAMVAGTTQAPLTAILTIFELTGNYQILLPLMFACAVSTVIGRLLHRESIYTEPLVHRGVRIGGRLEELVMDRVLVRDVMRSGAPPASESDTIEAILNRMMEEGRKELFVVDDDGRLRGTITLAELSEYLGLPDAQKTVRAAEVAYAHVPVLQMDDRLSDAIGRWSQVSRDRLPVVDARDSRTYMGELSAGDIISLYSQEVLRKEARLARFERAAEGGRAETTYVELPTQYVVALVTLPSTFKPTSIQELGPRRRFGINVIEIKRPAHGVTERRIIPAPETEVRAGDSLIVVGRPGDIAHLRESAREEGGAS